VFVIRLFSFCFVGLVCGWLFTVKFALLAW